jgi:hypothetical protein
MAVFCAIRALRIAPRSSGAAIVNTAIRTTTETDHATITSLYTSPFTNANALSSTRNAAAVFFLML